MENYQNLKVNNLQEERQYELRCGICQIILKNEKGLIFHISRKHAERQTTNFSGIKQKKVGFKNNMNIKESICLQNIKSNTQNKELQYYTFLEVLLNQIHELMLINPCQSTRKIYSIANVIKKKGLIYTVWKYKLSPKPPVFYERYHSIILTYFSKDDSIKGRKSKTCTHQSKANIQNSIILALKVKANIKIRKEIETKKQGVLDKFEYEFLEQ